ncbi:MAG: YHS domain-containing (seleno)protein [Flavobacteriaceae bacterium]
MKFIYLIIILVSTSVFSQETDCNVKNNLGVNGYDLVAYFAGEAVKGKEEFTHTYNTVSYNFSNKENLEKFKATPVEYLPQYGGWCAYAMADKGEKVDMNPETFEIRDGKLYLFYKAYFNNTYKKWLKENPEKLRSLADENWDELKAK